MDARTRLGWVRLYEEAGNAGLVCRRCGISRPSLRKWWRRYQAEGEAGLRDRSRRPHASPGRKVLAEQEALILRLRREHRFGIKRLRNELARRHGLRLALDTIHKVLVRHGENRLERPRPRRKGSKRYSRPVPGDRVQMDTCKIAPGLYQYTAIDDCSRFQVLGLYPDRTAASTLAFLDRVAAGMPFPLQRVQTDRGGEFFAYEVQDRLRERCIKFRPNRPRSPHLNGPPRSPDRVRCADRIDRLLTVDGRAGPAHRARGVLVDARSERVRCARPARSVAGLLQPAAFAQRPRWQTPVEWIAELTAVIPSAEAVRAAYHPDKEHRRRQDTRYRWRPTTAPVT